jgi:deoxycytidine triphosphate deaminase
MILGKKAIEKLIKEEKLLEDYDAKNIEGAGYDLRVSKFYATEGGTCLKKDYRRLPEIKEIPESLILLKPNEYILIETMEKVNMPANVAARVLNRSSLFRSGCSTFNAFVDPGFRGTLTFGLKNISDHEFSLEKGAKVAQIVFEEVKGGTELYNGKYQGGKVV